MSGGLGGALAELTRSVFAPAVVGFLSAALVAGLSQALIFRRFRREMEERFRFGFFDRQLEAYQELWTLLAPVSYYRQAGDTVVVVHEGCPNLHVETCRRFHAAIREFFYSKHGLFLSRAVRSELFEARDFVERMIDARDGSTVSEGLVPLTRKERKEVEWRFDRVRIAVRNDLGLRDLEAPVAAEGRTPSRIGRILGAAGRGRRS